MRYFIAILILIMPSVARAVQTCEPGYYKPSPDSECKSCPTNGYYCPDDDNDDAIPCPLDTTDWNTLLEGCGYHPLQEIHAEFYNSWWNNGVPAHDAGRCFARDEAVPLQEGWWNMESLFKPSRGDYWNGCDWLLYFYSANPGYYLSGYHATGYLATGFKYWYYNIKPCTNEHPEHSHYSGPGTPDDPVKTGGKTDYNDCPWACDDGYGRHNDECLPLCTAGATKFHVGEYVFNIYKDKLTSLAINIGLGNGAVCYVPLVEGSGKGALNVNYHGTVYHTSD